MDKIRQADGRIRGRLRVRLTRLLGRYCRAGSFIRQTILIFSFHSAFLMGVPSPARAKITFVGCRVADVNQRKDDSVVGNRGAAAVRRLTTRCRAEVRGRRLAQKSEVRSLT